MDEEDYLSLSRIQHFVFCKRQWALLELEQIWFENKDTTLGKLIHENVDDPYFYEKRKDRIYERSLRVKSDELKIVGICDLVIYEKNENGVEIENYNGLWLPYVVEYKKGRVKKTKADIYQLVAEVMCLEEMHNIKLKKSALYYKSPNKRLEIDITDELRQEVRDIVTQMYDIYNQNKIPKASKNINCKNCSLVDYCMPKLTKKKKSAINYINRIVMEEWESYWIHYILQMKISI